MLKIQIIGKSLIVLLFSFPYFAFAEPDADRLFAAGDWDAAADAYMSRTIDDPEDAVAWFRFAVSARQAGRYDAASAALDRAEALKYSPVRVGLERARLGVIANDAEVAIAELQEVASSGFTAVNVITDDRLLMRLAGHSDFDELVATMSAQAYPCEHDELFSAFDFWVGEWDVHVAGGAFAGSNRIESAQRGCVLIEHWRSATGGTGTSINYLDKTSDQWVQIWNDAGGSQINIRGGMTGDGMLLTGTIHYVANGTTSAFRGLWTPLPDGRVRQFFEQSSDDGETWMPWFEGFYTRKPADAAEPRNSN
jgi:hypothetical protein